MNPLKRKEIIMKYINHLIKSGYNKNKLDKAFKLMEKEMGLELLGIINDGSVYYNIKYYYNKIN